LEVLAATQAEGGVSFVMTDYENSNTGGFDPVEQMVWKTLQIDSPDALVEKRKLLGIDSNLVDPVHPLIEKPISKSWATLILVEGKCFFQIF
jgi:hypothetical protein